MKKLINTGKFLAILSLVILQSCKKDSKVDFPTQTPAGGNYADFTYNTPTIPSIADADAILAAVHVHNYRIVTKSPVEKEYQYGMAFFANTTGNFSSLVAADSVSVDTAKLVMGSDNSYISNTSTYSLNFSGTNTWKVKGIGSVSAATYTDVSADPTFTYFTSATPKYWDDSWVPLSAKDSITNPTTAADLAANIQTRIYNFKINYTIPIKAYASNADTVFIIFNDGAGYNYQRKVAATDSIATFKPMDFWGMSGYSLSNLTMQINAVKYHNAVAGTKKNYYLKVGSYIKYWKVIY